MASHHPCPCCAQMLPNINMIYLGASVLILLDMAYLSRTRTRIEPP